MLDCRKCQSPKDCQGFAWYDYGSIRWCRWQVLWILTNSEALGAGIWPPSPDGSSYIDPKIKTGYGSEAYFVKPVVALAEVERRLKRTGLAGKLLKAEVAAEMELSSESGDALRYVSDWRKKDMSYSAWKKQRRYRRND